MAVTFWQHAHGPLVTFFPFPGHFVIFPVDPHTSPGCIVEPLHVQATLVVLVPSVDTHAARFAAVPALDPVPLVTHVCCAVATEQKGES